MRFMGKIATARDIGNYAAGFIVRINTIPLWAASLAFDALETFQQNKHRDFIDFITNPKFYREYQGSKEAQSVGYKDYKK